MEIRRSKRMLAWIAVLYGGAIAFMCYRLLVGPNSAGRIMIPIGIALASAVFIPCLVMLARDSTIGAISEKGISLKSWGVGLIPWGDIASFSLEVTGDGGRIICLHLHDEKAYLSRIGVLKASMCRLRKISGFSLFVIYPSNIDLPIDTIIERLRRRVSERGVS